MKRLIDNKLVSWYKSSIRKPLILKGARQVGKTYSIDYFGNNWLKHNGGKYYYFDFKKEKDFHGIFKDNVNAEKIVELIEIRNNIKINLNKDLLFFDEIQECPNALYSLKYFEQDLKPLAIIAAGSHLGLIKNEDSFPVGKVNLLSMFPMTFYEYVWVLNEKLIEYLDSFDIEKCNKIPDFIHNRFLDLTRLYFATGGLPEVVNQFKSVLKESKVTALNIARTVQNELLTGYESDFSKYSGTVNANHIYHVFNSIPSQLSKSFNQNVKKYKFSGVIPKQKGFARIIGPLSWLSNSKLCIKSLIANRIGHPLLSFTSENFFKIFYFDIGLLNARLKTPMDAIIRNELDCYKGFIVENFVAQELYSIINDDLISWNEGTAEIEFIVTRGKEIIPLEVKAASRSRQSKSLDSYIARYKPSFAYKITNQNAGISTRGFSTIPIYLVLKVLT